MFNLFVCQSSSSEKKQSWSEQESENDLTLMFLNKRKDF